MLRCNKFIRIYEISNILSLLARFDSCGAIFCRKRKRWRRPPPASLSTESRQQECRPEIAAAAQKKVNPIHRIR
jgi:hypothetical protein